LGAKEKAIMATAAVVKGLEGVVAANSGICWIDGYAGVLAYRGIDIHELADHSSFEETTFLLWHGHLPSHSELAEFSAKLAAARRVPPQIYEMVRAFPKTGTPMEGLRTAVSADGAAADAGSGLRPHPQGEKHRRAGSVAFARGEFSVDAARNQADPGSHEDL
jgi:citrate synthase